MKLGILGSGRGTNAQAIIDSVERGYLKAEIATVLSDVVDAPILERGRRHNIVSKYISPGKHKTWLEPEIEAEYVRCLKDAGVELIALAGFMRILKKTLLDAYNGRIMNIHPALLPAFPGLEGWKQALEYGAKFTGCTVHFVTEDVDAGPVIIQAVVPVLDDDTPESLHARIQEQEHIIYPEAIKLFIENRLEIVGRRVLVKPEK